MLNCSKGGNGELQGVRTSMGCEGCLSCKCLLCAVYVVPTAGETLCQKPTIKRVWGINIATTGTNKNLYTVMCIASHCQITNLSMPWNAPCHPAMGLSDLPALAEQHWELSSLVWCATAHVPRGANGWRTWSHTCFRLTTVILLLLCRVMLISTGS